MKEIGDLTPNTTSKRTQETLGLRAGGVISALSAAQHARYEQAQWGTLKDWGFKVHRKRRKSDPEFAWTTEVDATVESWRALLALWLVERPVKSQALRLGEFFLNYLIAHPSVARTPEEFCSRSYQCPDPYKRYADERHGSTRAIFDVMNLGHEFIEWVLDNTLTLPDDYGRPVRSPDHWNPITRQHRKQRAIQTHREAIPTRYLREMIAILTEDDFAWPKSKRADWITRRDSATGQWEKVWSPIRASALLLKMYLPLRTYQIRMLDSGEGDSERYCNGRWTKNEGALRPKGRRRVRRGFLRKFSDPWTGEVTTGFFVNTNKTQDKWKRELEIGYEIPWQHEAAIQVASMVIQWQETYNPLSRPQKWTTLHDQALVRLGRSGRYARKGEICFLFRDPNGTYPNEPLTDSRLRPYWTALLEQLELRVAERGETLANGEPIRFVETSRSEGAKQKTVRPIYDLHTLRVSLITALATEGGVPVSILSKCIAGHASMLMTLYYVKPQAAKVTETLTEAQKKVDKEEHRNFMRFLQEHRNEERREAVASNDNAGIDALNGTQPGTWAVGDKGICPVGGTMCHLGGPKLTINVQLSDYAPTPGGPQNCVRCRFFITGTAFLGGLVSHFNATGYRLTQAAGRWREHEAEVRKLEDAAGEAATREDRERTLRELEHAQERNQRRLQEVDVLAHNLHAIYRLTERCKQITRVNTDPKKTREDSGTMSLVLAGGKRDLTTAIEMTTDFEVMDAVCQDAVMYPDDDPSEANLRRSRVLDAMLLRNGQRAVFASLSEEEILTVGNELGNLLRRRLGRVGTVELMEGRRMLREAGIESEVGKMLGSLPKGRGGSSLLTFSARRNSLETRSDENPPHATGTQS